MFDRPLTRRETLRLAAAGATACPQCSRDATESATMRSKPRRGAPRRPSTRADVEKEAAARGAVASVSVGTLAARAGKDAFICAHVSSR